MSETAAAAYDAVRYPGVAFDQTHPDRLAAIAFLFGMQPAPPSRCRVLELGCGSGANLVPLAYGYPESAFLGIDISAADIAQGRAQAAACGLRNVTLELCDIMDVDAGFGTFDYIIAHGVYSWVPARVREKILSIFRERLAPHGVAFVSYNAYPGSHLRDLGRRMMLYHVRMLQDAGAQVRQARALLQFLADTTDADGTYGAALRGALARVGEKSDAVLYHDDLDGAAKAFLFHEVAEDAGRAGLQFLSEAVFAHSSFGHVARSGGGFIEQIPEDEVAVREQYVDFFVGRWFREALFCHAERKLDRRIDPQRVRALFVSGCARPSAPRLPEGDRGQPIMTAALDRLEEIWPQATDFSTLAKEAVRRVAVEGGSSAAREQEAALAAGVYEAYRADMVALHVEPPVLTAKPGERPLSSLLARRQAERGPIVTNLRHETIRLDEVLHPFLMLVDGTRTVDELAGPLAGFLVQSGAQQAHEPVFRDRAEQALAALARLALLLR
ncbi:MAG TPA: class I SAM-dependent methyltransferase [Xanthobacteraceae bacterium]|nr:class I SAM-dependent methyltransferase [Xanthobacteraceae bacterium]